MDTTLTIVVTAEHLESWDPCTALAVVLQEATGWGWEVTPHWGRPAQPLWAPVGRRWRLPVAVRRLMQTVLAGDAGMPLTFTLPLAQIDAPVRLR